MESDRKCVSITLKSGKEKPVRMGHPWIFSGAVSDVRGSFQSGDLCRIQSHTGEILGMGYYNPASTICVRMLTRGKINFTEESLVHRIRTAIDQRTTVLNIQTDSCRFINSEGDFLPGLIVDKIGNGLVVQFLTYGMERLRGIVLSSLIEILHPQFIYERSDTESRKREGLTPCSGLIYGNIPETIVIRENGLSFSVSVSGGQKTGYFFDQRTNRFLVRSFAEGKSVCDCFSYSGGFALNALSAGALQVDVVDVSENAIAWAKENSILNKKSMGDVEYICHDVFKYLRETDKTYDLIVLDPPKFAKHPRETIWASRGYKDINLIAFKKIKPGGILFTFSCSQAVDMKLFRQIVFAAAADSGKNVQLLHILSAGPDHPVNIAHIEGEYLKGLVLRVV